MIGATHRFHGLGSLRFAYSKGKTVRGQKLALKYALNTRRQTFRAAVVVAKKVHKSAVVRNRIRRRVYAILGEHLAIITQPYDLIISVYSPDVATMSAEELAVIVKSLLGQAGVLSLEEKK
jgi:ribonuclease P protein component